MLTPSKFDLRPCARERLGLGRTLPLVVPPLMPCGKAIEQFSRVSPVRHEAIHQRKKPRPVRALEQVNHLVCDDVLEVLLGLLGELGIETNGAENVEPELRQLDADRRNG